MNLPRNPFGPPLEPIPVPASDRPRRRRRPPVQEPDHLMRAALHALIAVAVAVLIAVLVSACASSSRSERDAELQEHPALRADDDAPSSAGAAQITLEPIEGHADTVDFHIGAPLFLRLRINPGTACQAYNGYPFFFDATGAQLGWGFEEVADSLLFPDQRQRCERIIMLSSDHSNRLAEGYFSATVELFVDEHMKLHSDTIILHPVHANGADALSYGRFLVEQILRNGTLLGSDRETVDALFADGVPQSAESEIYRAAILYRLGDIAGAMESVRRSAGMQPAGPHLSEAAALVRRELSARMQLSEQPSTQGAQ